MPRSPRLRTIGPRVRRAPGSKPVVGSSRKISRDRRRARAARSSRRRWPPESRPTRASALCWRPDELDDSSTGARRREKLGVHRSTLAHAQEGLRPACCSTRPDAVAPARVAVPRIGPSRPDVAGTARAVALEDLDGRRLAGAVGAEQPEDLTGPDLEVDPAHDHVVGRRPCADRGPQSRRGSCRGRPARRR